MIAAIKYLKTLGFNRGMSTYFKLKHQAFFLKPNDLYSLHPPNLKHPVFLRSKTSDRSIFNEIYLKKGYQFPLNYSPKTIIDAGANIGLFSVLMANRYPQAEIIAIEPDPENFELLEKNTKPYPQIKLLNYGLWSKQTRLEIQNSKSGKSGTMVTEAKSGSSANIKATSVPNIMNEFQWERIDIIKIDIEGSEKEVFAIHTDLWLPKTKTLIIELHDRIVPGCSKTVFKQISKYDFSMEIMGQNLLLNNLALP